MREQLTMANAGGSSAGTSLSVLISKLSQGLLKEAQKTKTEFTNQIPAGIFTVADEKRLVPVLEEVLEAVIGMAKHGRIYVSAEKFRDIIILEVEERNNYNGYALSARIKSLEPLARSVGGYITLKGQQELHTRITLSFPDEKSGAAYYC